jgi:GNAT superfamily N-acetyltransferase
MNRTDIKRIERAAANALPPSETVDVNGWTVILGRGTVNRLNAAVTNGYRPRDLMKHVEATERRIVARKRQLRFRLTELDQTVDSLLDARGYVRTDDVIIMTTPLGSLRFGEPTAHLVPAVTPGFLDRYQAWAGYDEVRRDEIGESLAKLSASHVVAIADHAVAVGVMEDDLLGLFDVAVEPAARRQGLGRRISLDVLSWGRTLGASVGYLQVHSQNEPALALYSDMGFSEAYRYWYRVRSTTPR